MKITSENFMHSTVADFSPCTVPAGRPDFVSDSGSSYWLTEDGVIRQSDHWGEVASCWWSFANSSPVGWRTGFAQFASFELTASMKAAIERGERMEEMKHSLGRHTTFVHSPKNRIGTTEYRVIDCAIVGFTTKFVVTDIGRMAIHTITPLSLFPAIARETAKTIWLVDGRRVAKRNFAGYERMPHA